ncbi:DUF6415 family natural product biosynthesis protein [Streptomyces sp. MCC20]|uniref:DUF6415 family natural product biosynthesis protein n=1 Tax=Streptomyces sediminimaris TaxID=3383721 RepID=UPI00399A05B4
MTDHALAPGWTHPVREAVLPGSPQGLQRLLEKVQNWAPYVDGLLLDDVAAVLDDHMPGGDEIAGLAPRLRSHLMRLVNLAVTSKLIHKDREVAALVERGRALCAEELPGDHHRDVGYLRRLAWTLNELLELMVMHQCLTEEP